MLGPKTDADLTTVTKSDKKAKNDVTSKSHAKKPDSVTDFDEGGSLTILDVMRKINFHAPGENYKTDGYVVTDHTHKLLQEHLKVTGGKVNMHKTIVSIGLRRFILLI